MKLVRLNMLFSLITCLMTCFILGLAYISPIQAVTDAELDALEKQIEQQEAEERQKIEAEEKKKIDAEQKRNAEAAAKKKRLADLAQKKREDELKQRKAKLCGPRILPSNSSAFPGISQLIYNHPAFKNIPAPKVKWSNHHTKYVADTNEYSYRSNTDAKKTYLESDEVAQNTSNQSSSESDYVNKADSSTNSSSQTYSTSNHESILASLLVVSSNNENTDKDGAKTNSSSTATIINAKGILFPLKNGNKLNVEYHVDHGNNYKYEYKVEYHVEEKVKADSLNMGLTCNVFVITAQLESNWYEIGGDNKGSSTSKNKYYFSEQLGIFVKNTAEDADYVWEEVLIDYELLPEFNIKQISTNIDKNIDASVADTTKIKRRELAFPEKHKAEVAVRLQAKDPEGAWLLDSETGCAIWNSSPQPGDSFTWSGDCFDGMLSGKGTSQFFKNGKKIATIKGEYVEGVLNGHGTKSWTNGDSYEGEFSDGYRTGQGIYKWASGDRYEGNWKDNVRHGYGVQSWVSLNQQYEGQWENDKPAKKE